MRSQPDPLYKNVLRCQNPTEILLKDRSKFNGQNLITEDLLKELNKPKLKDAKVQNILGKTPLSANIELCSKSNKLKAFNEAESLKADHDKNIFVNFKSNYLDDEDNNNNNNNNSDNDNNNNIPPSFSVPSF